MESSTGGLRNPAKVLYEEVWNDRATWTDALFWYCFGAFSIACIWIASVYNVSLP